MKDLKESAKSMSPSVFEDLNKVLSKHGYEDIVITSFKMTAKDNEAYGVPCPPGKRRYCYVDISGRTRCICI